MTNNFHPVSFQDVTEVSRQAGYLIRVLISSMAQCGSSAYEINDATQALKLVEGIRESTDKRALQEVLPFTRGVKADGAMLTEP